MQTNILLVICASFIVTPIADGQKVQYANRIRNFSIESETDSGYLTDFKIYLDKNDHKIDLTVNITKDIHIKFIEVILYRCSFEKFDCENFQRWKFADDLKSIAYMKNQMWTPIFQHLTPILDFPIVKKNIYHTPDAHLDTNAILRWYPEVVNFHWRDHTFVYDENNNKALMIKLGITYSTVAEKNEKKERRRTRTTTKIPD